MNKNDIKKATVTIKRKCGRGVLVAGNLIITAAHCINWSHEDGAMILGDFFIEEIVTTGGDLLKVMPLAVEPVADIAVLGSLDPQDFDEEVDKFDSFCDNTKPVTLCLNSFDPGRRFPVRIYTHTNKWVNGTAERHYDPQLFSVVTDEQIAGGTSGSPIVNECGELVGIVSNSNEADGINGKCHGTAPFPHMALPVWIIRHIMGQGKEE